MADRESPSRKPRADASRNRERLLAAARGSFAAAGAGASLEEIARRAGVGIGTLYRHFPSRDALIEAVYRQAIGQLGEAAERLAEGTPPLAALQAWLLLFVDYLATKKIMAGALGTLTNGTADLYAASGATLEAAIGGLVARAEAAGEICAIPTPLDLLRAIAGIAGGSPAPDWEDGARRMVALLIAGLRSH